MSSGSPTSDPNPEEGELAEAAKLEALETALAQGDRQRVDQLLASHPELAELAAPLEAMLTLKAGLGSASGQGSKGLGHSVTGGQGLPPTSAQAWLGERYRLERELGRGAMGVVYLATDQHLRRQVAIKLMAPGQALNLEHLRRFSREARAAASLRHPGIVTIHDVGELDGVPYFTMDYLPGQSLACHLRSGLPQVEQAVRWLRDVARAVHYLHQQGLLHRDLKPSNLLFDAGGSLVVTDFGLVHWQDDHSLQTSSADFLGTLRYMPPEQAFGPTKELTPRSDLYSLGAILYEMLCGRPVLVARQQAAILLELLEGEPPPPRQLRPELPRSLEAIALRCLQKDPHGRYGSAEELAADLDHWLRGEPLSQEGEGLIARYWRAARREPAWAAHAWGIGLLALIIFLQYFLLGGEFKYHVRLAVMLAIWLAGSAGFAWMLRRAERSWQREPLPGSANLSPLGYVARDWGMVSRWGWCVLDVVMVTWLHALTLDPAGPIHAAYPLLIAASGLWFREAMVYATTVACLIAYCLLVTLVPTARGALPHYLAMTLLMFVLCGGIMAYQVRRLRTLSRYLERDQASSSWKR